MTMIDEQAINISGIALLEEEVKKKNEIIAELEAQLAEEEHKPHDCKVCIVVSVLEKQLADAKNEIEIWQSVFPQICPKELLSDETLYKMSMPKKE